MKNIFLILFLFIGANAAIAKHVLITGGAGFIGSHLCDRLLKRGDSVHCVDNLSSGSYDNVKHLENHSRFTFSCEDIADVELKDDYDEIFHLAALPSPAYYLAYPLETLRTCLVGAQRVLEVATRSNCPVFFSSTSEVYGDPMVHPQVEEYWGNVNPIGPRSCYDEGKRCSETFFYEYYREFGTKIKIARIFNTYGPRMHPQDGRVVSNFITQAISGSSITVYGDGMHTRSFCYVDDLVEAILRFIETPDQITGPINLGNPGEFTILELANLVLQKTGSKSQIQFLPAREEDPTVRRPSISKAKKILNWSPKVPLDEGLNRTIEYFQNRQSYHPR